MAAILHSFADLAKVMGCKVKAKKVVELTNFQNIEEKCGRKAACIWAYLQDQETTKKCGPKGAIIHNMDTLRTVTGYDDSVIFGSVIALVRNGYARLTANGQAVKAA